MSYSIIEELKREGSLVMYHDYRRGKASFADLSGNGNHGTPSNVIGAGGGIKFDDANGYIQVADSAELQLSAGTIFVLAAFNNVERVGGQLSIMVSKRDVGGRNYAFEMDYGVPRIQLRDSLNVVRTLAHDVIGTHSVAVTFTNGGIPVGYSDGLLIGNFNNTVTITPSNEQLDIGNRYLFDRSMLNPMWGNLIFNRILTGKELATVHGELMEGYS